MSTDFEISEDRRIAFDRLLLKTAHQEPNKAFPTLCEAWREAANSVFAWLWLYNEASEQWEVSAIAPAKSERFAPQSLTSHQKLDVIEFTSRREHPVVISKLDWCMELNGEIFTVGCPEELARLGCVGLVCVPLLFPEGDSVTSRLRAVMSCHFSSAVANSAAANLLLMGRLSAAMIANSYQAELHTILKELSILSEKYLTRSTRHLKQRRRNYCEEVIQLIKTHLGVEWASIFYQSESRDTIRCIATTGLWDAAGRPVDGAAIEDAYYSRGQGVTGAVYDTCNLSISRIDQGLDKSRTHLYREIPPTVDEFRHPWLFCPIRPPIGQTQQKSTVPALGVIRCIGNSTRFASSYQRDFDSAQIQILEFIARQLAPVLETMAVHIERERTVSTIRHDLFAPLRMIEDEVAEVNDCITQRTELKPYSLANLSVAIMIATGLVDMLDADLDDAPIAYTPEPTGLEGDIVARVRNMLGHYAFSENRMRIEFESIRDMIPRLNIDRSLTERVLCNLILNAVKYGKPGSIIRVVPRTELNYFCIDVVNQGIGIEPEDEQRIFNGRNRGGNAIRSGKRGLGLGLKISRAAMEKQQGRLLLTSGKKEATVFTLQFPRRLTAKTL